MNAPDRPLASPLGLTDFRALRALDAAYVDKTASIAALLDQPAPVILFPRPRRFGKTLWLSTLTAWTTLGADRAPFRGLAIDTDPRAHPHHARYPVISLSFKDLKHPDWPTCRHGLALLLARTFQHHAPAADALPDAGRALFNRISDGTADTALIEAALSLLCHALHLHTGEKPLLLIDEYDTPLHAAWVNGYYDEAISLFRNLLSSGLKDNPHLAKGVMTGILRIAKENIFSGLNNVVVYDTLHEQYATAFGFTEPEVETLAAAAHRSHALPEIRTWYDGYRFGDGEVIYNPWSVLSYLGRPNPRPEPYWVATSDDAIIRRQLILGGLSLPDKEALIAGETLERPIRQSISPRDLAARPDAIWSLLLQSGYLTAEGADFSVPAPRARLRVPNREIATLFESLYLEWLQEATGPAISLEALVAALFAGDADTLEAFFDRALRDTFSSHDLPAPQTEAIYHAFVLGLLVHLAADYDVRSNRESGYGRADVLIIPKAPGRPGAILELKTPRRETPEAALDAALAQIEARDYAAELRARGAHPIIAYAIVFADRRAHVRAAQG